MDLFIGATALRHNLTVLTNLYGFHLILIHWCSYFDSAARAATRSMNGFNQPFPPVLVRPEPPSTGLKAGFAKFGTGYAQRSRRAHLWTGPIKKSYYVALRQVCPSAPSGVKIKVRSCSFGTYTGMRWDNLLKIIQRMSKERETRWRP